MGQRQRYSSQSRRVLLSFLGGKRTRSELLRRVALPFEIRGEASSRAAELWMYGDDCIHRWRIPLDRIDGIPLCGKVVVQLHSIPVWTVDHELPRRDHGRCVIDASVAGGLRDVVEMGRLSFSLHGEFIQGEYRLERTPMEMLGKPQWLIWKDASTDQGV